MEVFDKCVDWLKSLGLQEYQAKAYVALLSRVDATAQGIAEISKVPPTKIYGILQSLEGMGFVKSSLSRPKRYRPIDIKTAVDSLIQKHKEKIDDLEGQKSDVFAALDKIYTVGKTYETPRDLVWMVSGENAVWNEVENIIRSTKKEFNVITTLDEFKYFFASKNLMKSIYDVIVRQGVNSMAIFPDTLFKTEKPSELTDLLKSIKSDDLNLIFKTMDRLVSSPNMECRTLASEKIHTTFSIQDNSSLCITLRYPHQKISSKKLIIHNENIARIMKDHFLSLWELGDNIGNDWIDVFEETVEFLKNKKGG